MRKEKLFKVIYEEQYMTDVFLSLADITSGSDFIIYDSPQIYLVVPLIIHKCRDLSYCMICISLYDLQKYIFMR